MVFREIIINFSLCCTSEMIGFLLLLGDFSWHKCVMDYCSQATQHGKGCAATEMGNIANCKISADTKKIKVHIMVWAPFGRITKTLENSQTGSVTQTGTQTFSENPIINGKVEILHLMYFGTKVSSCMLISWWSWLSDSSESHIWLLINPSQGPEKWPKYLFLYKGIVASV